MGATIITSEDLMEFKIELLEDIKELLENHKVSDTTFNAVKDKLGVQGVTDLTVTVGYYSMISCVLNGMEMLPEKSTLPA